MARSPIRMRMMITKNMVAGTYPKQEKESMIRSEIIRGLSKSKERAARF